MNRPSFSVPLTNPVIVNPLWHSFDSSEEDRELWILEQEISSELERIENKNQDLFPIGKSGNENYIDEEEEEDEEEDDNDDDDSDSHDDDDDDEDIDMDVDGQDSPSF